MLVIPQSPSAVPIQTAVNNTLITTRIAYRGFNCNIIFEVVGGSVLGIAGPLAMTGASVTMTSVTPSACALPGVAAYRCAQAYTLVAARAPSRGITLVPGPLRGASSSKLSGDPGMIDVTAYPTGARDCVVGVGQMLEGATSVMLHLMAPNKSAVVTARGQSLIAQGTATGFTCTASYAVT